MKTFLRRSAITIMLLMLVGCGGTSNMDFNFGEKENVDENMIVRGTVVQDNGESLDILVSETGGEKIKQGQNVYYDLNFNLLGKIPGVLAGKVINSSSKSDGTYLVKVKTHPTQRVLETETEAKKKMFIKILP